MKKILLSILFVFVIFSGDAQDLVWTEVAAGVWKAEVGRPEPFALFQAGDIDPNLVAIRSIGSVDFPFVKDAVVGTIAEGQVNLRFPLERGEQLFGFGLNFKNIHQRGKILELHVDHYGGKDNGRTHAPVPFYVSDKGYGVFINSARYMKVWAGTGVRKDSPNAEEPRDRNADERWTSRPYSDAVELMVPAPGVEIYIFGGPTILEAVRRYNLFNGGGCLPPRWGLGFSHRVPRLFTAGQTLAEAAEF